MLSRPATPCILVVDDDSAIRTVLLDLLREEGFNVYEARDGLEALEIVRSNSIDLILLDLNMPRMDGWTFFETLREQSDVKVPVVIMTAGRVAIDECTRLGAQGALPKPFDIEQVLDVIDEVAAAG